MARIPASEQKDYGVRRVPMKRYLLTIVLSLFIVAGIGTYYAYCAADRMPEFRLSTVQGDAKEGESITLSGSYGGRMQSQFLNVTAEGSDYTNRRPWYRSFLDSRSYFYENKEIAGLIKEHRQFMRGKSDPSRLYKDQQWLIYAEAFFRGTSRSDIALRIDVLDLASGKTSRLETVVPGKETYSYVVVSDVQRVGSEIHILAFQRTQPAGAAKETMGGFSVEYYDYIVHAISGQLLKKVKLSYGTSGKKDVQFSTNVIASEPLTSPGDYALLQVSEEKTVKNEDGSYSAATVAKQLFSYAYKTEALTALPEIMSLEDKGFDLLYDLNGKWLYLLKMKRNSKEFWLSSYNLDTGQGDTKAVTVTAQQLGADTIRNGFINNGRVYIHLGKNNVPMAAVLDAASRDLLYKGEVRFEGPASEAATELKHLSLYDIISR
jgi:hypothetical protein